MNTKRFGLATAGLLLTASVLWAQPSTSKKSDQGMMQQCHEMMAKREDMKSRMESSQKELERLVAAMKQAQGEKKVDAMAKVVETLASQRSEMMTHMMDMQPRMMAHMMQHQGQGEAGMASCPMMKGMMEHPPSESER